MMFNPLDVNSTRRPISQFHLYGPGCMTLTTCVTSSLAWQQITHSVLGNTLKLQMTWQNQEHISVEPTKFICPHQGVSVADKIFIPLKG